MGGTSGAGLGGAPTRRSDVRGFTEDEVVAIEAVVAQLPIAVVVHSLDSVIVAANGECRELLGYDAGDLTGAPVTDFIPDSERVSPAEWRWTSCRRRWTSTDAPNREGPCGNCVVKTA